MIKKITETYYQLKVNGSVLPLKYDDLELAEVMVEEKLNQGMEVSLITCNETKYVKPLTKTSIEAYLNDPLFENRDFTDGAKSRQWWDKEFKKATKLNNDELKVWAENMKTYLYDFSEESYYVRTEIELLLNSILEN